MNYQFVVLDALQSTKATSVGAAKSKGARPYIFLSIAGLDDISNSVSIHFPRVVFPHGVTKTGSGSKTRYLLPFSLELDQDACKFLTALDNVCKKAFTEHFGSTFTVSSGDVYRPVMNANKLVEPTLNCSKKGLLEIDVAKPNGERQNIFSLKRPAVGSIDVQIKYLWSIPSSQEGNKTKTNHHGTFLVVDKIRTWDFFSSDDDSNCTA